MHDGDSRASGARSRAVVLLATLAALLFVGAPPVEARLDGKTWRAVQSDAEQLFGKPGEREAKARVVGLLLKDNERRSRRLLVDALVKEVEAWVKVAKQSEEVIQKIDAVESKPVARRYPEEQKNLVRWREDLAGIDAQVREQQSIFNDFTADLGKAPESLRKYLYEKTKRKGSWPVRAAVARVAAANPKEEISAEHFSRAIAHDKDPRVRLAALDALRASTATAGDELEEKREGAREAARTLIFERLSDNDWTVQLRAIRIIQEQKIKEGVPYLIRAMSVGTPRVRDAFAQALRALTNEEFDAYPEIWAKWWEDHKEEYETREHFVFPPGNKIWPDTFFYGLRIRSDRILFIIDASASMKQLREIENPVEKWEPRVPPTGPGGAPPPPLPREVLRVSEMDIAKHELKKAIHGLPETAHFNIIAFSSAVLRWQDGAMEASPENKKNALTWVRGLPPRGHSYLDGALRLAFRMAGSSQVDARYEEASFDTFVLLSDGIPTDDGYPEAKAMDPRIILGHVRKWNGNLGIVINCIGLDTEGDLLRKLAAENAGEFADR